jgi:hypothetical protein
LFDEDSGRELARDTRRERLCKVRGFEVAQERPCQLRLTADNGMVECRETFVVPSKGAYTGREESPNVFIFSRVKQ